MQTQQQGRGTLLIIPACAAQFRKSRGDGKEEEDEGFDSGGRRGGILMSNKE